jgi:hypothetical protein
MRLELPVATIMDRLAREERKLKNSGAYANAEGIRYALVAILRMADEDEPPIEPSGDAPK